VSTSEDTFEDEDPLCDTPPSVRKFAQSFDRGELPQYDEAVA
jgi:hypothetical protein